MRFVHRRTSFGLLHSLLTHLIQSDINRRQTPHNLKRRAQHSDRTLSKLICSRLSLEERP